MKNFRIEIILVVTTLLWSISTVSSTKKKHKSNSNESAESKNVSSADRIRNKEVKAFLARIEPILAAKVSESSLSSWTYATNMTKVNQENETRVSLELSKLTKSIQLEISTKFPWWRDIAKSKLRREVKGYFLMGPGNMTQDRIAMQLKLSSEVLSLYSKNTVCSFGNRSKCDMRLEPDLTDIMRTSTNYEELEYYWTAWHDSMSNAVPASTYKQMVDLDNEMAQGNGFKNTAEAMADNYEDGTPTYSFEKFSTKMESVMSQIQPYFLKLHAYVAMKLKRVYGDKLKLGDEGTLPSHVFGNMWAQEWGYIEQMTKPFPNAPSLDATKELVRKNYTVREMVDDADTFFQNMGLYPMTPNCLANSIFVRPEGREIECHPTAFDMGIKTKKGKGGDYRIKMCAVLSQYYFETIHHEMGHTQYHMHYSNLPLPFRVGANPGFHEAIGDTIAFGATSPRNLQCNLGLDLGVDIDCKTKGVAHNVTETDINYLYLQALQKLAFLPFAYSMETWRWEAQTGKISPDQYNDRWWELRAKYQHVAPPNKRPSGGFDPAAKYHIVSSIEYIRYFWSHLLQFQFLQGMCTAAGEFQPPSLDTSSLGRKPLYQCDFSGNRVAGRLLGSMLKMGGSKPWPEALVVVTGTAELSVEPMLNYFHPLFQRIDQELRDDKLQQTKKAPAT